MITKRLSVFGNKPPDQEKRDFFYQTMNGCWDSDNGKFHFGIHPNGYVWDVKFVTNLQGHASISLCTTLHYLESNWKDK
jgi:hypothetical protein